MKEKERKNFPTKVIDEVYTEQGGICGKCDKSLQYGYHAHHKDGDSSNNSKENCQLLCSSCHGGEKYATYLKQKEAVILDLQVLVKNETVSGATVDKKLDAVKLILSLQAQVYNDSPLQPPLESRMKDYEVVMRAKLEAYEEGAKDAYLKGLEAGIALKEKKKE